MPIHTLVNPKTGRARGRYRTLEAAVSALKRCAAGPEFTQVWRGRPDRLSRCVFDATSHLPCNLPDKDTPC